MRKEQKKNIIDGKANDLFLCGLFGDAVSRLYSVASDGTMSDEMGGMWKEAVVA
jgi:hypothetical protein